MFPKPIYEIMPYAYLLVGLFGLTRLESGWGKLCGLALIVSGVIVQQIRARYRTEDRLCQKVAAIQRSGHQDPRSARTSTKPPVRSHVRAMS
jgi:hypothetical protein